MPHDHLSLVPLTPLYLSDVLYMYLGSVGLGEPETRGRSLAHSVYRKYKKSCTTPAYQYLHKSVLGEISRTRKVLLNVPLIDIVDQFHINTIILMEWYSKVGDSKGDRTTILKEFLWQYAVVYKFVKYNKPPPQSTL